MGYTKKDNTEEIWTKSPCLMEFLYDEACHRIGYRFSTISQFVGRMADWIRIRTQDVIRTALRYRSFLILFSILLDFLPLRLSN